MDAVDNADSFEARYNFRFEEAGANEVTSYARKPHPPELEH